MNVIDTVERSGEIH